MANLVSDEACQIFGGRLSQKLDGTRHRSVSEINKFAAILGGSEEIMADLGIRQAMKHMRTGDCNLIDFFCTTW